MAELLEKPFKSRARVSRTSANARVCPRSRTSGMPSKILSHPDRKPSSTLTLHEERDDRTSRARRPPPRLDILSSLPCDWWVLELREERALLATLEVVREYWNGGASPQSPSGLAAIR